MSAEEGRTAACLAEAPPVISETFRNLIGRSTYSLPHRWTLFNAGSCNITEMSISALVVHAWLENVIMSLEPFSLVSNKCIFKNLKQDPVFVIRQLK